MMDSNCHLPTGAKVSSGSRDLTFGDAPRFRFKPQNRSDHRTTLGANRLPREVQGGINGGAGRDSDER